MVIYVMLSESSLTFLLQLATCSDLQRLLISIHTLADGRSGDAATVGCRRTRIDRFFPIDETPVLNARYKLSEYLAVFTRRHVHHCRKLNLTRRGSIRDETRWRVAIRRERELNWYTKVGRIVIARTEKILWLEERYQRRHGALIHARTIGHDVEVIKHVQETRRGLVNRRHHLPPKSYVEQQIEVYETNPSTFLRVVRALQVLTVRPLREISRNSETHCIELELSNPLQRNENKCIDQCWNWVFSVLIASPLEAQQMYGTRTL